MVKTWIYNCLIIKCKLSILYRGYNQNILLYQDYKIRNETVVKLMIHTMEVQYNDIIAYKDNKIYLKDTLIVDTNQNIHICIINYGMRVSTRFREWCLSLGVQIFESKYS